MSVQSLPAYFFTPQHIILVGASERPHSLGERILTALLNAPFQGKITPVNPRHKTIAGLTSYTNVARIEETADLVITVTPPETYESLFKACRKKQLHHVIIIQDWDNLPPEAWETAAAAIKKHHGEKLNISVCNPAGAQIPTQGLNAGILPDYPAGHVAVLTGQASLSSEINVLLRKMKQGVSRHISLNYDLSPTTSADWLNRFGHKRHTRAAVIHFNPRENLRKLFSAIRYFTRHTPIILHCTHHADSVERSILRCLGRHCNFIATFNSSELEAALHAHLSALQPASTLNVLSNTPVAWLQEKAVQSGISLVMPSEKPHINQAYIGSNPSPVRYRSLAVSQLQQHQTEALLAVVAPTAEHNENTLTGVLSALQQPDGKPLLISSPFSDGLLQFDRPEQAVKTLSLRNIAAHLQNEQNKTAKPRPAYIKTPQLKNLPKLLETQDFAQLAKNLHLPDYRPQVTHVGAQLTFTRHPAYGIILSCTYNGRTRTVLPPFSTLDGEKLIRFADLKTKQKHICQLLHSLNTLLEQEQYFGSIIINLCGDTLSSDFRPSENEIQAITSKNQKRPAAATVPRKNLTAAEFISTTSEAAAEFIRSKSEAAAEFLAGKADTAAPPENVRAPYPSGYPQKITLKDGEILRIRPFTPEDAEAKQAFVRSLSPKSRYFRFMAQTNELPQATLARFSNLDYYSEGAWIAENSDGLIQGISRFSRLTRDECEFGITLAENARGKGLAVELMRLIIRLATQQGYQNMSAEILKSNQAMLKLARKLGFALSDSNTDKDLYQVRLSLLPQPTAPKRKFRQ